MGKWTIFSIQELLNINFSHFMCFDVLPELCLCEGAISPAPRSYLIFSTEVIQHMCVRVCRVGDGALTHYLAVGFIFIAFLH